MLGLHIICTGTLKEKYLRDACGEYIKRLGAFVRLDISEAEEDELPKLRKLIPQKAFKVALCIEGKQLSSEELAGFIEKKTLTCPDIAFIIGGSEGLPDDIKNQCDFSLSFSKMTFPHQLMRLILLEQLYRAQMIIHGGKYHK